MSQENVELVRRLLEMFDRREHEAVFAFYAPDIEWDATRTASLGDVEGGRLPAGLAGVYRGHDGVRTYWRRWLEAWKDLEFEVQDVLDAGDEVVALIRNSASGGDAAASPPRRRHTGWCSPFVAARSCAGASFRTSSRPSKPPGCRSRRCRRRTSNYSGVPSNTSRGLERSCVRDSTPTLPGTQPRFEARYVRGPMSGSTKPTSGSQTGSTASKAFKIEEVLDAGDQVVAIARQRGKAKHGGPEVEMRFAQVWTFRDGLAARMQMYAERDEALEAAGLSE